MRNKGFDQVAAGSTEGCGATEIRCIRLNQCWIEVVLTDQNAKLIPQPRLAIVRMICRQPELGLQGRSATRIEPAELQALQPSKFRFRKPCVELG